LPVVREPWEVPGLRGAANLVAFRELGELPRIDAHDEARVIGALFVGPALLAYLPFDKEFLAFLAILREGFRRFTPELEVDKVRHGFTIARLREKRVVIGERHFYQAFAILGFGEFGIGYQVAGQQEFVDVHRLTGSNVFCICIFVYFVGEPTRPSALSSAQQKFQPPFSARGRSSEVKGAAGGQTE
jgi:hypothetical protein